MEMSVVDDRSTVAALTGLLRDELREAQFHVSHLTRSEVKLTQGPHGGGTSTTLDPTLVEIWDADGLTALHADGGWRRSLFRSEIFVKILPRGPDSDTRSVRFERVLHDLGVVSDGCVGLALAPLLPVCTFPSHPLDSPEAVWERVKTPELWRYLLVDACIGSPRRTASKLVRWARGGRLAFETRVVLGRLCASEPFSLSNGLGIVVLPRTSNDLGEWLPAGLAIVGLDIATSDYLGRTILRIPLHRRSVPHEATSGCWPTCGGPPRSLPVERRHRAELGFAARGDFEAHSRSFTRVQRGCRNPVDMDELRETCSLRRTAWGGQHGHWRAAPTTDGRV